jgi:hypothetical protein
MAWVMLRRFQWTAKTNAHGVTEVTGITQLPGLRRLPVNLSDVISTNALATPVHRPILYKATLHELRLVGSYLQHDGNQHIRLLESPFRASARQIRGFVSESCGLGMLTATIQAAYRWNARGHLFNMDVLPTILASSYTNQRTRPDLLFDLPAHRLAGEARGRSHHPPSGVRTEHYARLNGLLPWAEHHHHPLVMTYTYLTGNGTTVDLFTPDTGVAGMDDPIGEELSTRAGAARGVRAYDVVLRDQAVPRPTRGTAGDPGRQDGLDHQETVGEEQSRAGDGYDQSTPDDMAQAVRHRMDQIEEQLFDTAPPAPAHVAGRPVRGEWTPLDLVGESTGSLLLALLDTPLSPSAAAEITAVLRQRIRQRSDRTIDTDSAIGLVDEPDSITIRGRLLVAITTNRSTEPWRLIRDDTF